MGRPVRRRSAAGRVSLGVLVLVAGGCSSEASSRGGPAGGAAPATSSTTEQPTDEPTDADEGSGGLPDDLLLPNMRSLAPRDLQVGVEQGERRLRFAGLLANVGEGPMVVRPAGAQGCRPRQRPTLQVVYRDGAGDGRYVAGRDPVGLRRPAGCTLDHPTHDHWHFAAMARYVLYRTDGREVAARDKVSFCLRDNERVAGALAPARRYFGECGPRSAQGISPGWVDVYSADLDGQWLRIPRGPGTYCLEVTADPRDQLVETDEDDNTMVVGIRVADGDVRRAPATCG